MVLTRAPESLNAVRMQRSGNRFTFQRGQGPAVKKDLGPSLRRLIAGLFDSHVGKTQRAR
jgi:hypothetical protein